MLLIVFCLLHSWVSALPEITTNAGLQIITHDIIPMRKELRPLCSQSTCLGIEETASRLSGAEAEKARELIAALKEEMRQGTSVDPEFFCMLARKPI